MKGLHDSLFTGEGSRRAVECYIDMLVEAVCDISRNAQHGIDRDAYIVGDDNRDLMIDIRNWAKEFIDNQPDEDDDPDWEYLEAIDDFSITKLTAAYGVEKDYLVAIKGYGAPYHIKAKTIDDARHKLADRVLHDSIVTVMESDKA